MFHPFDTYNHSGCRHSSLHRISRGLLHCCCAAATPKVHHRRHAGPGQHVCISKNLIARAGSPQLPGRASATVVADLSNATCKIRLASRPHHDFSGLSFAMH